MGRFCESVATIRKRESTGSPDKAIVKITTNSHGNDQPGPSATLQLSRNSEKLPVVGSRGHDDGRRLGI